MLGRLWDHLEEYARTHTSEVPRLLQELREETYATMELPQMQVGPVEGTFLRLLVRLSGARRAVEIGTFTGYSALMIASGLPDDGALVTCDIDPKAAAVARRYFERSEHGPKIQLRLGPALETLAALEGPFDFVFIDADKAGYVAYWEAVLPKLRPGGLVVADNVLWSGQVLLAERSESTEAIVAFNAHVRADPRVEHVLLTVRDGMTLAVKR